MGCIYVYKNDHLQLRDQVTSIIDPSEKLRPEPVYSGKLKSEFRNYTIDPADEIKERVRKTYENMHTNQTVEFVRC